MGNGEEWNGGVDGGLLAAEGLDFLAVEPFQDQPKKWRHSRRNHKADVVPPLHPGEAWLPFPTSTFSLI